MFDGSVREHTIRKELVDEIFNNRKQVFLVCVLAGIPMEFLRLVFQLEDPPTDCDPYFSTDTVKRCLTV